jgi:hypothetical protein
MISFGGQLGIRNTWHLIPTFDFVGGPCCPTLDFLFAFRIMTAFNSFFLFDIQVYVLIDMDICVQY